MSKSFNCYLCDNSNTFLFLVGYLPVLTNLNSQIAQLDCLVSFAMAAVSAPIPYVRPKMLPEGGGVLKLKEIRHPCLEMQENVTYITNDVDFERDELEMYIITGPNMGGKSTYIRSVGVVALMAHVGSFVPCTSAEISILDSILGRVGAGDCLMKGLSTFMVEMVDTTGILRAATNKSLVIIDELGRGTSTYDGCGMAFAIAEKLAMETKCFSLFATHFHEITDLSNFIPTVKNYHLAAIADQDTFTLLFQIRPGVMDRSFGIQVAKLAKFPAEVIYMAQELYAESDDQFSFMKSQEDKELLQVYMNSCANINIEDLTDVEVLYFMNNIRNQIKQCGSEYFQKTFPALFLNN